MQAKLLIKNVDHILTMDKQSNHFKNADLLIEGNRIVSVGVDVPTEHFRGQVMNGRGYIIIPGMINLHHHCTHTLLRNLPNLFPASELAVLSEIYARLPYFNEQSMRAAALGGLGDLLKTGCTTSCDHLYAFPKGQKYMMDAEIEIAKQLGIRFHALRGSLSRGRYGGAGFIPDDLLQTVDEIVDDTVRVIETYHDKSEGSMLRVGVAPSWIPYEAPEAIHESVKIARHYGVSLHSHLADSREEFAFCQEKFGCTPVEYADKLGCLFEGNFFAHCVQLTKSDYPLLAKAQVAAVSCPNSDMLLNTGVAKLSAFLRRDIRVGIAVDGAASNNTSNMIAELRNAYLIQRYSDRNWFIPLEKFLYMVTAGSADILGRSDIGRLAPEKMADFVMLNWSKFQYAGGKNDPLAAIILSGDARMVEHVFVNGKMVVQHGMLSGFDETMAAEFINEQAEQISFRRNATVF